MWLWGPKEKCPGKFQLCSIHQTQHKLNISHSQESQQGSQKVIFSYSRQFQRICEFQDDSDFAQAEATWRDGIKALAVSFECWFDIRKKKTILQLRFEIWNYPVNLWHGEGKITFRAWQQDQVNPGRGEVWVITFNQKYALQRPVTSEFSGLFPQISVHRANAHQSSRPINSTWILGMQCNAAM